LVEGIAVNGLYHVSERSRSDDPGRVLRLDPAVLRDRATTLFGEERARLDLVLLRRDRRTDLRLVYDGTVGLDGRFSSIPEETQRRERSLQLERDLGRGFTLRVEGGDRRQVRRGDPDATNFANRYAVDDQFGAGTLRWRLTSRTRTSLELRTTRREDRFSGIDQNVREAVPGLTADLLRGRWTVELRWAEVREEGGDPLRRPYFFERPGTNRRAALAAQWNLGRVLTFTFRWQLRDEPGRDLRQDLAVETRARF
jgi:hypothetical protein